MSSKLKIIIGLGNPGKRYAATRHNLGWMVVEALAEKLGADFREEKQFESRIAHATVDGQKVLLVLPETYMNESGRAIQKLCHFYKIASPDECLAVVDDMAIEFGVCRLRKEGSAGGHNGLKSLEAHFGTREYPRLRIGIGRVGEAVEHVLGYFTEDERQKLPEVINVAAGYVNMLLKETVETVMNVVNRSEGKK